MNLLKKGLDYDYIKVYCRHYPIDIDRDGHYLKGFIMLNDWFLKDLAETIPKYQYTGQLVWLAKILIEVRMPVYNQYYSQSNSLEYRKLH